MNFLIKKLLTIYIHSIKNIFNYKGRAPRIEVWCFIIINGIILILAAFLFVAAAISKLTLISFFLLAFYTYLLIAFLVLLSLTFRRMHDTNNTGWYPVFGYFIYPFVSLKLNKYSYGLSMFFLLLTVLTIIVFYFKFFFKAGDKFQNDYGFPEDFE